METIEQIGAVLGLAAFLGLAVLVLLYFQQARDVRRLREWAGKAPERAAARSGAATGAATGERAVGSPEAARGPSRRARIAAALSRAGERFGERWRAADRRSPVDLRILAAVAVASVAAAVVLSGGFGLLGEDETSGVPGAGRSESRPPPPAPSEIEVAVLNGTTSGIEPGIPGLAGEAGRRVSDAGFRLGAVGDTDTPFVTSVIMHDQGSRREAMVLADEMGSQLGGPEVERMSGEVRTLAEGAGVALVVGQDNADL